MAERVVVTGGAGFIGSELVSQLVADGVEVVVLDDLSNGKRSNLAEVQHEIQLVEGDVRDSDLVEDLVAGVAVVFHLACLGVRHSLHDPFRNHDVNATGTLNLLRAARKADVPRFVNVSTSEVYGTAKWVPMTAEHPTFPMTVYGSAKLAGECYARAFYESYGYPTVVIRPFNSFGPHSHHEGDSGEVIPKFVLRALAGKPLIIFGDGTQTRDFTYVADTARGIALAGFSDAAIGLTLNIGQGRETTINELATTVGDVLDLEPDIVFAQPRPGDVLRLYCDPGPASEVLGYRPTVDLRDGLRLLVDWYESHEESVDELLAAEHTYNWQPVSELP